MMNKSADLRPYSKQILRYLAEERVNVFQELSFFLSEHEKDFPNVGKSFLGYYVR